MKRKILSIIAIIMVFAFITGCSGNPKESLNSSTPRDTPSSTPGIIELPTKDRSGNDITVPQDLTSIISLAPPVTEILVSLGIGDKIAAVDTNSVNTEGIKSDLPAFDMMSPDVEKLSSMKPSIVFVSGMSLVGGTDPFKPLKDMGICVVYIPASDSIQGIIEDISFIAQVVQKTDKGQELIGTMRTEIEKIANIGKTITDKKTVYFEVAAAPYIYSFGSGVFLNEMIEIIGAENVFANQQSWLSVEPETAVNSNPDVIMTNVNYIEKPVEEILSRSGWEDMAAIKNKQVFAIDSKSSSLSNHNILKALKEMAEAVYPDRY
jgi:iron complex transport system substrate-binding protein